MDVINKDTNELLFTCTHGKYDAGINGVVFKSDNGVIVGQLYNGYLQYFDKHGDTAFVEDASIRINCNN